MSQPQGTNRLGTQWVSGREMVGRTLPPFSSLVPAWVARGRAVRPVSPGSFALLGLFL